MMHIGQPRAAPWQCNVRGHYGLSADAPPDLVALSKYACMRARLLSIPFPGAKWGPRTSQNVLAALIHSAQQELANEFPEYVQRPPPEYTPPPMVASRRDWSFDTIVRRRCIQVADGCRYRTYNGDPEGNPYNPCTLDTEKKRFTCALGQLRACMHEFQWMLSPSDASGVWFRVYWLSTRLREIWELLMNS